MKNQIILVNTIDFPLLVPQKLSVESSINDEVRQKSKFNVRYIFSVKNLFHSDHSAKCTSSQTENEQATQARQLLICTRSMSSLLWSVTYS